MGFIATILLGIAGSFLAGIGGQFLGWYKAGEGAGFIASVIVAILLLVILRQDPRNRGRWVTSYSWVRNSHTERQHLDKPAGAGAGIFQVCCCAVNAALWRAAVALLAAASSLVPLPGVNLVTDIALLTRLIGWHQRTFRPDRGTDRPTFQRAPGARFSPAGPRWRHARARLTTPVLVGRIVRRRCAPDGDGRRARLVPLAGQVVAAGIGYWSVNTVAMRHIAHCERIVAELQGQPAEN